MKNEKTQAQAFAVRQANDMPRALVPAGNEIEAIASSSCGDSKGRVPEMARPLRLQCRDCEELLHQLANVITPILMHAQMLEWKLPPYSHLKRSVRELERNARRGSELLKALIRRAGDGESGHRRSGAGCRSR